MIGMLRFGSQARRNTLSASLRLLSGNPLVPSLDASAGSFELPHASLPSLESRLFLDTLIRDVSESFYVMRFANGIARHRALSLYT